MLVSSTTTGATAGANDPVVTLVVPAGPGSLILSNKLVAMIGETIEAVPPVKVTVVGAMAGTDVQAYFTVITPILSLDWKFEHLLPKPAPAFLK